MKQPPPLSSLKRNYFIYFETALILSISTFIGLFKLYIPTQSENSSAWVIPQEMLFIDGIIATSHAPKKTTAPPMPIIPNPEPTFEIIEERLLDIDMEIDPPESLVYTENTPVKELVQNIRAFVPTIKTPVLIGGLEKLQKNIYYPKKAIRDKVEGRVILEFIVDKKGKVREPRVLKGVRKDVDRAAIRAISKAKFKPARQKGKPIAVEQVIHILFVLDAKSLATK